jgi:phosphatidylinositol alpha-mannosyltransferase
VITSGPSSQNTHDTVRIGRNALFPINGALVNVTLRVNLRRKLRRVFAEGRFDLIHIHSPMEPTLPLAALMAAGGNGTPVVGTFHMSARVSPAYELFGGLLQKYAGRLDARIAVSDAARRFAARYFPGEYSIVPNGVDLSRFLTHRDRGPGAGNGRVDVLFVGRFDVRKNIPWLVSTFRRVHRRYPHARLVLVGTGLMEPLCRLLALPMSAGSIVFEGRVPASALPGYYSSSHIFCSLPSGSESFGIVLLEAMAAGKPIIGTDIDGYREVVKDGIHGILVRPGDTRALAEAMSALIVDEDRRRRMGENGIRRASRFDWSRIAASVERVYEKACGRPLTAETHANVQPHTARLS